MNFALSTKQKQVLVVVLALVLILGISCCSKSEPPAEFDPMGTVSADNLNVRKKPDSESKILGRLPVDLEIEILEQKTVDDILWGRIDEQVLPDGTQVKAGWVNLQTIYSLQTIGEKAQRSLSSAMEHFGIEQTRVAHDALGDAYNTALVCSHLDMEKGLRDYADAARILAQRTAEKELRAAAEPQPIEHTDPVEFVNKADAFASDLARPVCPICKKDMESGRWLNQGDQRYMNMFECEEHGKFLTRLKFKKSDAGLWAATRLIYIAGEDTEGFYRAKAQQARRRGRRHPAKKKNDPAK